MINIQPVSPDTAREILALLQPRREERELCEEIIHHGFSIKGFFDVVCREENGDVAWEAHQPNLLTDHGRRMWNNNMMQAGGIFTSGVIDPPLVGRYCLIEGLASSQAQSTNTTGTVNASAFTKTWSTTFGVPGSNRQVAVVGIMSGLMNSTSMGATGIMCYSLLTPVKVQTTTQSLEISYRLTLQPGV